MFAAQLGYPGFIDVLKEHELKQRSVKRQTALIQAAAFNHPECTQMLTEEARMQDDAGWTALMWAAHKGHAEQIPILIELEAKMINKQKETALILSAQANHADCAQLLLVEAGMKTELGATALMIVARSGFTDLIHILEKELKVTNNV